MTKGCSRPVRFAPRTGFHMPLSRFSLSDLPGSISVTSSSWSFSCLSQGRLDPWASLRWLVAGTRMVSFGGLCLVGRGPWR